MLRLQRWRRGEGDDSRFEGNFRFPTCRYDVLFVFFLSLAFAGTLQLAIVFVYEVGVTGAFVHFVQPTEVYR